MIETKMQISKEPYPLYIGSNLIENLDSLLYPFIKNKSIFILTEDNVFNFYGKILTEKFKDHNKFSYYVIPAGEESKSIKNYRKIVDELINKKHNRSSVIIAVGGGMIGDLGGFVASTYMRGISIIHVPTTLLAQVDSSVGGKTGINYENFKNLLGAFYHPKAVVMDTTTLKTLPSREFIAAFGEIIKYGIIGDYEILIELHTNYEKYLNRQIELDKMIFKCIKIKERIVVEDEMDFGLRQTLNLGHTFAHGIETSTGLNKFFHGEAVAVGLICDARISLDINLITNDYYLFIKNIIYKYFSNVFAYDLNIDQILEYMIMDKKNSSNSIRFVLPTEKEQVKVFDNIPLETVKKAIMEVKHEFSCK